MKSHTKILLPVLCVLVLSACTTSFYYNRLDWLIPWYVDDYIDLSSEQKQSLKVKLEPYLNWHRQEELNNYINSIEKKSMSNDKCSMRYITQNVLHDELVGLK